MILGKDKKKLSKRRGAQVSTGTGYGLCPTPCSTSSLCSGGLPGRRTTDILPGGSGATLRPRQVIRKPSIFDMDKLNHVNQEHLKRLDPRAPQSQWSLSGGPWASCGSHSREYLAQSLVVLEGGDDGETGAEFSDYFLTFDVVKNDTMAAM